MGEYNIATKKRKPLSKREARLAALVFLIVAILGLGSCIRAYFYSGFLVDGSAFNAVMVHDMRMIIKVGTFWVLPALSILLILSSCVIWRLTGQIDNES